MVFPLRSLSLFLCLFSSLCSLSLSGCQTQTLVPSAAESALRWTPHTEQDWVLRGKLIMRSRPFSGSVRFRWTHHPLNDQLDFSSPTQAFLGRLSLDRKSQKAYFINAQGEVDSFSDVSAPPLFAISAQEGQHPEATATLLRALPLWSLSYWIEGRWDPAFPISHIRQEAARGHRLKSFVQEGWRLSYVYAGQEPVPTSIRVVHARFGIKLEIVLLDKVPL